MSSPLGRALTKEAVSKGRLRVSQSRKGRRPMSVATYLKKEKNGTLYKTSSLAQKIAEDHLAEHPDYYERLGKEASYEEKLPWYTTATGGYGGLALGKRIVPKKYKALGAVGGLLAGTALGLEGGTALGKKLDAKTASAMRVTLQKIADSQQPASRLFLGSSRGADQTIEESSPFGIAASSAQKSGDSPTRNDTPGESYPKNETSLDNRQVDVAQKVAAEGSTMGHLVGQEKNQYPSRADVVRRDPVAAEFGTSISGFRDTGAAHKTASEEPYTLSVDEWEKVAQHYLDAIEEYDSEKLASADLEELHKEAFLGALRKVIPKSKKIINVGGETIDLRPTSPFSYKAMGKKLEETGNMFRLPKNVSPQMAQQAGNMRAGSAAGRIVGEGFHSAGHHMGHASTLGKAMNPLGKPVGGFIEGITKGTGQELQRSAGVLGKATGGGAQGAIGRSMVKHAPKVGIGGEVLTGAATATGLGHAVSPAAHALGGIAKSTGVYAPAKAALGKFGLNVAKDAIATGAELGAPAVGRLAGRTVQAGRGLIGAAA